MRSVNFSPSIPKLYQHYCYLESHKDRFWFILEDDALNQVNKVKLITNQQQTTKIHNSTQITWSLTGATN